MRVLLTATTILLLAGAVQAQTKYLVSPAAYTSAVGNAGSDMPFCTHPYSHMQIHDDLKGRPLIISGISFRQGWKYSISSFIVNLTLSLSTAATTSTAASKTFANNHGNDLTEVVSKKIFHFPDSAKPSNPPAPFKYEIPFPNKPFKYQGTGGFCWDLRIHSTINTYQRFAFAGYQIGGRSFGIACRAAGQPKDAYHASYIQRHNHSPYSWRLGCDAKHLGSRQPYLWLIGMSKKNWGPLSLPLNLAPWGAPSCTVYVCPHMILGGITASGGSMHNHFTFPHDPHFSSFSFYTQVYSFAPGTPGLPIVFTAGHEVIVPYIPFVTYIRAGPDTAKTGSIYPLSCVIARFSYN